MACQERGMIDWGELTRSAEGHRTYRTTWLVESDSFGDGPYNVMNCPGLPLIGSTWDFEDDMDAYAYCTPEWRVRQKAKDDKIKQWVVEIPFTTRPTQRCQDNSIENPLGEPPRLSGGFTKFVKEQYLDRFGKAIKSTSHEIFRGSAVEFDDNRPNVQIEMNLSVLPLADFSQMVDTVNDGPMWGLPARCVKLSNVSWRRLVYGTCNYYYSVMYEFDVNFNTFDRRLVNEGTKCLKGWGGDALPVAARLDPDAVVGGVANYLNPQQFEVYKDVNGENTRVLLDEKGRPLDTGESPYIITFQYYQESNFFTLGIPASL